MVHFTHNVELTVHNCVFEWLIAFVYHSTGIKKNSVTGYRWENESQRYGPTRGHADPPHWL